MKIKPTNISKEEKMRIFNESLKNQTPYTKKEPVKIQPISQWISCQDKMPEEYKTVLVYEKDYGVMIGELEKKIFDTQYFIVRKSGLILRTTEVTHWQPLPDPPKDGDIE